MRPIRKFLRIYNGFILPVILITVSAAVIFWGVLPGINSIKTLYSETETLSKDVGEIKKRVDFLNGLDEQTLRMQMEGLLRAVPPDKSLPTFFSSLEAVAAETGVTISEFSIENPGTISTASADVSNNPQMGRDTDLTAKVTIGGTLDQLKSFFGKLISVRRLFRISTMSLQFKENTDTVVSGLTVNAFFAPLPSNLGKASAPIVALSPQEEEVLNHVLSYPLIDMSTMTGNVQNVEVGTKQDPFSLP